MATKPQTPKPIKKSVNKRDVSKYEPMWVKAENKSDLEQSFLSLSLQLAPDLIWNLPDLEWRFSHNWRFDFVLMEDLENISSLKIAIECEGLRAMKMNIKGRNRSFSSRHLRAIGYTEDCHKYNCAMIEGWSVYRLTSIDFNPKSSSYNPHLWFEQIRKLIEIKKERGI